MFFERYVFISDQNFTAEGNRNRNCIVYSLGNNKGGMMDYFFCALNICYNFPYNVMPSSISVS